MKAAMGVTVLLGILVAVSAQVDQESTTGDAVVDAPDYGAQWTPCNTTTTPRLTCQDCNTRLICKPIGGILVTCRNPQKPYCNNGICSPVPSAGCA